MQLIELNVQLVSAPPKSSRWVDQLESSIRRRWSDVFHLLSPTRPVAYSNILLSTAVVLLATVGLCVPPFLSDHESGVPELLPIESSPR